MTETQGAARRLPLHALHEELGARFVNFAGYAMPVNYAPGILQEHRWCRESAALFDVSHMGQITVAGREAALALESVIPADLCGLAEGDARYCLLTNEAGGIRDDLIATRTADGFHVVVNAACREADLAYLGDAIGMRCAISELTEHCLVALQGPRAAAVMQRLGAALEGLGFMRGRMMRVGGIECRVTRSGYTGEDGFEISVGAARAEALARTLLAHDEVRAAGLGARDSLRLEAGLCLYGHDIDASTTPVEAGLQWTVGKARRPGGARRGGYPGAQVIERELDRGAARKRVGLAVDGKMPVREGAALAERGGAECGRVTSGGFSPTLERPIAMGYVAAETAQRGGELVASVRGRDIPVRIAGLPFVEHRYFREKPGQT